LKIILFGYQNNYIRLIARMLKLFVALSSTLKFLYNYFDGLTKIFLDLYLAKFLDPSAKLFFPCSREGNITDQYNPFSLLVHFVRE